MKDNNHLSKNKMKNGCTTIEISDALHDRRLNNDDTSNPKVSFIVTCYNYEKYIEACLRSVVRQTYDNWECLVVDDVSSDNTVPSVQKFLENTEKKKRFQLIERKENGGQMKAFRDGLNAASGSFVVMLDADDVLLEDFIEVHLHAHLNIKTVAFTSSNQYQINAEGEVIGGQHMDHQSKGFYRHVNKTRFQKGFWIWATSSSMVFRKSTVELIMPTDETNFRICADYYIAHFCHLIGDSLLIPGIHGCYRRHGKNNFGSNPVLGNINSVGSMDRHPPHDLFRQAMINHILKNHECFYTIYGGAELVKLLLRLVKISEIPSFVSAYPKTFPQSSLHYFVLALLEKWAFMRTSVSEKFKILPQPARTAS